MIKYIKRCQKLSYKVGNTKTIQLSVLFLLRLAILKGFSSWRVELRKVCIILSYILSLVEIPTQNKHIETGAVCI